MRRIFITAVAVALAALSVRAQSGTPAVQRPDSAATSFLGELRRASARGDRQALAALVRFPIVVTIGSLRVPIENARAFVERFDAVFTPELKDAVARSAQNAGTVSITPERVAIGADLIVARAAGGTWRIVEIRVPPPKAAGAGGGAAQRISVRAGPNPTQMTGALSGGAMDSYLVRAARGQLLEIRIEGVQGRDIVARIFEAASGVAIDARTKDGVRAWSGRVAADGDYRIDVVRLKPGADVQPYTLSVRTR